MIPQISAIDVQNIEIVSQPSRTYRLGERKIEGFIDGLEAIKQAVYHILRTERYAYPIYEENFGAELEQYIGKPFAFIQSSIGESITEALMQDDRIISVEINSVEQSALDSVLVNFTVISSLGTFEQEVPISV